MCIEAENREKSDQNPDRKRPNFKVCHDCPDFDQVFYPILNAVRISPDFDQLSSPIRSCRGKIIATTIHNTDWWHNTTIFHLTKNLCIKPANDPANIEYAKYILDIGNNCAKVYDDAMYNSNNN